MEKRPIPGYAEFANKLRVLTQRTEALQQRTEHGYREQAKPLPEVLDQLQVALEELRVAEDELQRQAEELAVAQHAIETERQRYRDLFEFAPDAYIVTDAPGMIREVNRAGAELLGVSQSALVGKPLVIFIEQTSRPVLYALLQQMSQGRDLQTSDMVVQPRNREAIPVSVRVAQIQETFKGEGGCRWLLRDITQQIQAQTHLRELNASLETRVLQRTADLQRSNDDLQQFAHVASHDLQEPLRTVNVYVQMLAKRYRGHLDPDADEFIEFVVDGATRMEQMIVELLRYSRVGTRQQELTTTSCEDVFRSVLKSLQILIADNNATVTHDPLPYLYVDGVQLSHVWQNLLSNAIKFRGPEPPRIHVSMQRQAEEWLCSVRDNGIGVDPRHAERIFVIFQRLHTRREYPGTGMGLAICKRIIERHGGRMWVESEPEKGSTFYFTLPVGEAQ